MMSPSRGLGALAAVFLILAVTSAAFLPSLENGFVNWDDHLYVSQNPAIRSLAPARIGEMFSSFSVGNYQPLTILSYALDYHFSGSDPFGYHATQLVLHLVNCLFVFWLVFLIGGRVPVACLTALLFGVHPLHVESVAWVSARKDVLYALFFLGALICYCYYLRGPRARRFYYGALVLFLFSLLSKAMAITLPLVLLLFDSYLGRKDRKLLFADKVPFFVLSVLFGGIGFFAQYAAGAVRQQELFSFADKILVAPFAVAFYLFKTAWPLGLSALYPYFVMPGDPSVLLPLVALCVAALGVAVFVLRRPSRVVVFSSLFFLLTLLPVLQLVPLGHIIVAERYMYIPCLGIFYGLSEGFRRLDAKRSGRAGKVGKAVLALFLAGVVGALGILTWTRCRVWRDSGTLWEDVLVRYPRSSVALNNLGAFYAGSGRHEEAIVLFRRSLEIDPRYAGAEDNLAESYVRLGILYHGAGRNEEAARSFERAIEADPRRAVAYNNLGSLAAMAGRREEAIALFRKALAIDPAYAEAHRNLALALALRGQE